MDKLFDSELSENLLRAVYALTVASKAEEKAHNAYRDGTAGYEVWRTAEHQRHEATANYGDALGALRAMIAASL